MKVNQNQTNNKLTWAASFGAARLFLQGEKRGLTITGSFSFRASF